MEVSDRVCGGSLAGVGVGAEGGVCGNSVGIPLPFAVFPGKVYLRWDWARGWGRLQGSAALVHPPAELSSTAGPQGQGEGRGSSLSIHSLPSGPSSPFPTEEQPVASWGLSFERLLQDPLGLAYFTVSPGVG